MISAVIEYQNRERRFGKLSIQLEAKMRYILSLYILGSFFLFGQNGITVGDIDFSYSQPKEYELGPIRVIGADNFDHQAIKLIAGLRQGQKIILPSNDISKAIKIYGMKRFFQKSLFTSPKKLLGLSTLQLLLSQE